jgi:hypothetical protein
LSFKFLKNTSPDTVLEHFCEAYIVMIFIKTLNHIVIYLPRLSGGTETAKRPQRASNVIENRLKNMCLEDCDLYHNDTPFGQAIPGRPISRPGVGHSQGVFGIFSYY